MRSVTWTMLFALLSGPALAADASKPHPHQGLVRAWSGAPPAVSLNSTQEAALARGEPVKIQSKRDGVGVGVAVQDVAAPPEKVWSKITDFRAYPRMVSHVTKCEPYSRSGDRVKVDFAISAMGSTYEYYVDHRVRTDQGYITWTLDYSRESDLDDSVGYWKVDAHPTKPGWSRITYSVQVRLRGWVPGFVEDMLASRGLTDATSWVKRESER